jgi:methionine synthase II (cobalamin-independent)
MFQPDILGEADGIERVGEEPIPFPAGLDARPLRIADGVDAASIVLPPLGYADAAIESYRVFTRLRDEGVVPAGIRFQVSLATPVAVVTSFFAGDDRAAIAPVYTAAILDELARILDAIPHEDLAIQWDVASEMGIIEHAAVYGSPMEAWWGGDPFDGLVERLVELVDAVPEDVEAGVHLCYGDIAEHHFLEPADTSALVRFANAVITSASRPLSWLHLPVPIEREDAGYYAALASLEPVAELYLGLVHREDGTEGAGRRIAAASAVVPSFGVATECGIGRAPEGMTEGILRTHAEVAAAW